MNEELLLAAEEYECVAELINAVADVIGASEPITSFKYGRPSHIGYEVSTDEFEALMSIMGVEEDEC